MPPSLAISRRRVDAEFPDAELNTLAGSVNKLVETVDRGIAETGAVLAALAQTDLTQRVNGDYRGRLRRAEGRHQRGGRQAQRDRRPAQATPRGALKTATGEILSGANDLSERTTKQAATIEETSAAMEQLAATVLQNASGPRTPAPAAETVTQDRRRGRRR